MPFAVDEVRPGYRGALLAPWPNRVVDGRYTFGDREFELALTEPARSHALHGLAAWLNFTPTDSNHAADQITLEAVIEPQTSYPWRIRVSTTFTLSATGLAQTMRATNESADAAPVGLAAHPYLIAGPGPLDSWTLELQASEVLEVSDERLIPLALSDVALAGAARFDWRSPRTVGPTEIDHAFTGLTRRDDGLAELTLTDPSGTGVRMTWDHACPWVQVHTADLPGGPAQPFHRAGLAVEPMTCAPDAFNARQYPFDTGLITVHPGESVTASWMIEGLSALR